MNLQLTKQTLAELNRHRGQLDEASGRVFLGVRGRRHKDGLWHVVALFRATELHETPETFSLLDVIDPQSTTGEPL